MQSFRTELENKVVERDILKLEKEIRQFTEGEIDENRFRGLRLARGVYGQRQSGVQMVRIKIPYGKMSTRQLRRIADVSDEYSTGKLHVTTRQDVQLHYVSLDKTPQLWKELEKDGITIREAGGNTVRNITASALAGVDPEEPFDVSPYAHASFEYFLRNPIAQGLGRKIKIAFSSSDKDTACSFIHDLGFIPKIQNINGEARRGFKVLLAGGLGALPMLAYTVFDFLPEEQMVPFSEAVIRVFAREGERINRNKARLKFLVKSIGVKSFLALIEEERAALKNKIFIVDNTGVNISKAKPYKNTPVIRNMDTDKYIRWRDSNVVSQKQEGFYAIKIKLQMGDFSTGMARQLANVVDDFAADDIRLTIGQGIVLRYVRDDHLQYIFTRLDELGLAEPGSESTVDITVCPGTDTCNLGISNSTGIAKELEKVMNNQYPDLIYNNDIKIKISGCMNSCGQHALANIGFHGSALKFNELMAPALQVLLGGGVLGNGEARVADKVIKIPSKRGPLALKALLNDYNLNKKKGELFNDYYDRNGKKYFYDLLKEIANTEQLTDDEMIDWGAFAPYKKSIGVGECAGTTNDLVLTLLLDSEEKMLRAKEALGLQAYADSIYHAYSALINGAKALLTGIQVKTNSQRTIINSFDEHFVATNKIELDGTFEHMVLKIKQNEPTSDFAISYFEEANNIHEKFIELRQNNLEYVSNKK